ncbi:MAG: hypothetical protein A2161_00285, partial [Candidatus Schekmanbacteria bacterium RBG_13_48_7]
MENILIFREDICELLKSRNLLTQAQIEKIKQVHRTRGGNLVNIIFSLDMITQDQIIQAVASQIGLPFVKVDPLELDSKVVTEILPGRFCQKHKLVVIARDDNALTIAIGDPFNETPIADIQNMTGMQIKPVLTTIRDVDKIINFFYGMTHSLNAAEQTLAAPKVNTSNLEQLHQLEESQDIEPTARPLIKAVNQILYYAFEQRASDIHIEPKRDETVIRFRIDGVLHTIWKIREKVTGSVGKKLHSAILSRIKMMGSLDISEKRKSQDGRIKISHAGREIEIRISTLPITFGEKVVMRIFDPEIIFKNLSTLGYAEHEFQIFKSFIEKPYGIILVTGPTGSGKTTTLYSSLNYLSNSTNNITTIEDPIEMVHENFNQIAVRPKVGMTFANSIRTILRQDPDIIMIGEIRDVETASNAIQAALTGHLVLSTLHTNDAPSAITRLIDMGVESFLISSTVIGVVAQRLVRKICSYCAVDYQPDPVELKRIGIQIENTADIRLKKGKGCVECRDTGFYGRTGIFEIMEITSELRKLIHDKADTIELRECARREGMVN